MHNTYVLHTDLHTATKGFWNKRIVPQNILCLDLIQPTICIYWTSTPKWKQRSACLWGTPCPWLLFFCQCKFHEGNPFQYIINFGKSSFSVQCLHTTYLVGFCVPSWFCHKNFNAFYVCRTLKHLLPIYYKLQSTDGFNVLSPDEWCRYRRTASPFYL